MTNTETVEFFKCLKAIRETSAECARSMKLISDGIALINEQLKLSKHPLMKVGGTIERAMNPHIEWPAEVRNFKPSEVEKADNEPEIRARSKELELALAPGQSVIVLGVKRKDGTFANPLGIYSASDAIDEKILALAQSMPIGHGLLVSTEADPVESEKLRAMFDNWSDQKARGWTNKEGNPYPDYVSDALSLAKSTQEIYDIVDKYRMANGLGHEPLKPSGAFEMPVPPCLQP